ncbi:MAG TPA: winged helix-turn-helix domain-containing protein [Candidatus Thermoplasmatota archaeon]|nr:winged helix-turn-helix domain-containing protein [Candidatus Thermoplasmatota archaeon]
MPFTAVFGDGPHVRVFDFLLEADGPDHTISDIARGAHVARPTVYKVVGDLLDAGLLSETRTVGNSRFFALNERSRAVRALAKAAPHVRAVPS